MHTESGIARQLSTALPDAHARMLAREFAAAPVEGGVGVVPTLLEHGRVALEVSSVPGPGLLPRLAIAVDIAIGVAVHRGTPEPSAGPTLELRLDMLAEPAASSVRLRLEGEYLSHSGGAGTARVTVQDTTGAAVAHAVGTMVVEAPVADRDARLTRFVDIPPLDADRLVADVFAAPGDVRTVRLPVHASLSNLRGSVHGGVVLALGGLAQERAVGGPNRIRSTTVDYLRPLPTQGTVECRTETVRSGRRFRTLRSELLLPDGRIGAIVTTTRELL
ncbi:acyl-CoA thioesterase domain-containing protein [Pseudonocardia sp. NPDC049154]|uniref:PaaI family thioesterase n=1 Tax=Pseudonocardia sp. NPDC049154 TaxID=3155501 RepID=UPI003406DFBF